MLDRGHDLDPPVPGVVRTVFNICRAWQLNDAQTAHLLGATDLTELADWRGGDIATTTGETTLRMGHIVGIYGCLVAIIGSHAECVRWVGLPNSGALFEGITPLDYMLGGGIERLSRLRVVLLDILDHMD